MADAALDAAGRPSRYGAESSVEDIQQALSIDLFDPEFMEPARRMAVVYQVVAAFENGARQFISKVLLDTFGDEWWDKGVSDKIRRFAEGRRDEEVKTRWHGTRSENLLGYTELNHLVNIMTINWESFEPYVRRLDWATSIFSGIERSRNVIMHSGVLDIEDVERLGIYVRDWIKQVGI
jgi:hypothetical protein